MAEEESFLIGITSVIMSTIVFGLMFLPVRRFTMGDGAFVQFMMGIGIFIVGFLVYVIEGFPPIYPFAMLGGLFWAIGNIAAIPLINELGLALAILIWNTTACISGWATSRFGLFGLTAAPPKSNLLNYIGLIFVIVGGIIYMFVKSTSMETHIATRSEMPKKSPNYIDSKNVAFEDVETGVFLLQKKSIVRKAIAIAIALTAGMCFGQMCTPVIYIQDHPEDFGNAPSRGLVYVFSHFTGIVLSTSMIFLIYAACRKNQPWLTSELALPATITGAMWATAMALLFVSNEHLSQTIAFPMITTIPGCIASLLSVFYYKEIKGRKNLIILSVAFTQTMLGAALIAASKKISL